jgi:hypothetical protein
MAARGSTQLNGKSIGTRKRLACTRVSYANLRAEHGECPNNRLRHGHGDHDEVGPRGSFGGYEMTPERDDLTVVEHRICAAKEYIYQHERLIERLADEANNTGDAFALLNILNRALRLFERYQLLLDRLGDAVTQGITAGTVFAIQPS